MKEKIIEGIRFFLPDENIDLTEILTLFKEKKNIKRNEFLVKPGINPDYLSFIISGSFRVFYIDKKGNEITTWFAFPNMWVTDLWAYYTGKKAKYYVKAMEKSEIFIIKKNELNKIYKNNPLYLNFAKNFAEYGMIMMMQRCDRLQALTAKERYLELLKMPIIKHNVPYKYIASYLGITETSLSRLKKELF